LIIFITRGNPFETKPFMETSFLRSFSSKEEKDKWMVEIYNLFEIKELKITLVK